MSYFLVNLLLALLWTALQNFQPIDFVAGLVLGYGMIWLARNWLGPEATRYVRRVPRFVLFVFYYLGMLVSSTLDVMRALFRDQASLKPGIFALPLDAETDLEIVVFNSLLGMTPGTLGIALSPDRRTLYVHVIDIPDVDSTRRYLKTGLERRLLEVIR